MAHIVINALSLRPGGGLQVICGLLARFGTQHTYTVLWSDPQSRNVLERIIGTRSNIRYDKPLNSTSNGRLFLWQFTSLRRYLTTQAADLVVGVNHHFPSGSVPQVIYHLNTLRFDRPVKPVWNHGEIADRLRDWRAMCALRKAEANVFESAFLLQLARAKAADINRASVIHIGLDDNPGRATFKAPHPSPKPHIMVMTSPQPHKDNPVLVEMLAELKRVHHDVQWRLKIAGGRTPDAFDDLKHLAARRNVEDRIDWLGFRNHDELAQIGHKCLCLVSASRAESFCMVALEAMSWGCPAIVTDMTSMPESVGDAGVLVKAGDVNGFAAKVLEFHENPDLRHDYALRGLAHAGKTTWSQAAAAFERIFGELLAKKR